ncbi:hypothetical protein, partial [Photobacterium damselae]|uniref:hypothetical protein n=1 Tax=Photobacterium damselae TaxID=38293 RepID=UPI004068B069
MKVNCNPLAIATLLVIYFLFVVIMVIKHRRKRNTPQPKVRRIPQTCAITLLAVHASRQHQKYL